MPEDTFFIILSIMATPIEFIIDGHSKRFSSSDLGKSKIISCKCWGNWHSIDIDAASGSVLMFTLRHIISNEDKAP